MQTSTQQSTSRFRGGHSTWIVGSCVSVLLLSGLALAAGLAKKHAAERSAEARQSENNEKERPADAAEECRNWQEPDAYLTEGSQEQRDAAEEAQDAYRFCRAAYQSHPDDAEIAYQLAASAVESGNMENFSGPIQRAAEMEYCKAFFQLGRDAWHDKDADKAEAFYQRGASCGDARAQRELFRPGDYAASAFPDYLEALYHSDIPRLNKVRFLTASYVDGFYEALSEQYLSGKFDTCWTNEYYKGGEDLNRLREAEKGDASNFVESYIYEESLPTIYRVLVPAQGSQALEVVRETTRKAGHADAYRMASQSHCKALLPYRMMEGIRKFALAKKSLFQTAEEGAPNIHSIADLQAYAKQSSGSPGRSGALGTD